MSRGLCLLLALLAGNVCFAQSYQEAKLASAAAEQAIDAGNFEAARETLVDGVNACEGAQAERCRLYLYYSLGYLEQRESVQDASMADMHLDRSAGYYENVLAQRPDHGPTLNNLALVYASAGDADRAAQLLERAVENDPARARQYALQLGDLLREGGKHDAALSAYRVAERRDPRSKIAKRRIIDVYRLLPERLSDLHKACRRWEPAAPDVARDGYAAGLGTAVAAGDEIAELFLMDWLRLMAEREWLSADSLAALPADWQAPAFLDLRAFVEGRGRPGEWKRWWLAEDWRRQTLALAALALARDHLGRDGGRDEKDAAVAFIEGGLSVAPPIDPYFEGNPLAGQRVVRLDLLADLASLSYRFPDLDISLEFEDIEERLFSEKSQAYREVDLATIQRFHTVLGLIYAERGTWESNWRFRNGIFQLSGALRTAGLRFEKTGFHQPQPRLAELLAGGYQKIGEPWNAADTFVDAAQGYLDTDQLGKAQAMLDAAKSVDADVSAERAAQLGVIVELRTAMAEDPGRSLTKLDPQTTPFLYAQADGVEDGAFLARQRFKVLADGSAEAAPGDAVLAFNTALDEPFTLVGTADLLRMEKVQALTLGTLGPDHADRMLSTSSSKPGAAHQFGIVLPGETQPKFTEIAEDAVVAARIGQLVQPRQMWREGEPEYRYESGAVMYMNTDLRQAPELLEQIKAIPGVDDVRQVELDQ